MKKRLERALVEPLEPLERERSEPAVRLKDEGIEAFEKKIPCRFGCKTIRFSTTHWRKKHEERFHFQLTEKERL